MYVGVQDLPLDKSPDKKNHNSRNINPIYNGLPDRKTYAVHSHFCVRCVKMTIFKV